MDWLSRQLGGADSSWTESANVTGKRVKGVAPKLLPEMAAWPAFSGDSVFEAQAQEEEVRWRLEYALSVESSINKPAVPERPLIRPTLSGPGPERVHSRN